MDPPPPQGPLLAPFPSNAPLPPPTQVKWTERTAIEALHEWNRKRLEKLEQRKKVLQEMFRVLKINVMAPAAGFPRLPMKPMSPRTPKPSSSSSWVKSPRLTRYVQGPNPGIKGQGLVRGHAP